MIAKIEGVLESLENSVALVNVGGGLSYQVLLPAYTAARLGDSIGRPILLHTLYFMESQGQGSTILPRLAGFATPEDRAFFDVFVTCKGIGFKKALRAMAMSVSQIAAAIADRDLATLQSLPEVGRRTAETIAVSLKGKVDRFIDLGQEVGGAFASGGGGAGGAGESQGAGGTPAGRLAREALEVLVQLGEQRIHAATWIDQILARDDAPSDVQGLVSEAYQLKAGR